MRNDVIIVRIINCGQRMTIDVPLPVLIPNVSESSSVMIPELMAFCIPLHESRY